MGVSVHLPSDERRYCLGIDVSKAQLDCALLDPSRGTYASKIVANSQAGYSALLTWLGKHKAANAHVILEPTGLYQERVTIALHDAGMTVSLVNPRRLRRYAEGVGFDSKTDAADSLLLARFGSHETPAPSHAPTLALRELRTLLARLKAVEKNLQREKNRAERENLSATLPAVQGSVEEAIAFQIVQRRDLRRAIKQQIAADSGLHEISRLLLSIPGVGFGLSMHILPLLAVRRFQDAKKFSAYLGLAPVKWESGTSVYKTPRLPKHAPRYLRMCFFYPAMAAIRVNPDVKALRDRLRARGMPKMAIIGAAMHKLAHQCFGVLRSGEPYDPHWRSASRNARKPSTTAPFQLCLMSDE